MVNTPLGPLALGFELAHAADVPPEMGALASGASVARWYWPGYAELRLVWGGLPPPRRHQIVSLSGYWGVLWSIRAEAEVDGVALSALLVEMPELVGGGESTGEDLQAVTYETDQVTLTIGTHDDDALLARASTDHEPRCGGPPLPRAWAHELSRQGPLAVTASESPPGLICRLPVFRPGDTADLHAAIGWAPPADDVAVWLAVDTSPAYIRAHLNTQEMTERQ